jgi:hypothetical protein
MFRHLEHRIVAVSMELEQMLSYWFHYSVSKSEEGKWSAGTFGSLYSLTITLKRLGVLLPEARRVQEFDNCRERVEALTTFLRILSQLANGSHLKEAQHESKAFTESFLHQFPASHSRIS